MLKWFFYLLHTSYYLLIVLYVPTKAFVVNHPALCYISLSPYSTHAMPNPIVPTWKHEWSDPSFRRQTVITIPFLLIVLFTLARFLDIVEARPGVVLPDPILRFFTPRDVTWLTFGLIYVGIIVGVGYLIRHPRYLLLALQSYMVMVVLRIIAMFLLPLEPPLTMIPLADPFVEYFGTGALLTKDLFFSGHTSTLFILFLSTPDRRVKSIFLICTVTVALCVLLQHVHYSIDVFAAPVFGYAAYRIVLQVRKDLQSAP
jgi:hypothetical protein